MLVPVHQRAFADLDAQLFTHLTTQSALVALPCFDLAARKLPLKRMSGIFTALTNEQLSVPID